MIETMTFSEKVTRMCCHMPLWAYIAALGCLLVLSATLLTQFEKARTKARDSRLIYSGLADASDAEKYADIKARAARAPLYAILSTGCMTMVLLSMLALYALGDTYLQASAKGYVDGLSVNPASLWDLIPEYPDQSRLPDDLSDTVVVCYKFGCEDCTATMKWIRSSLDGLDGVYYVSTRTRAGKKFTGDYPVDEVPSAVYIRSDGTVLNYVLYTNDSGTRPDTAAMGELLSAVRYARTYMAGEKLQD